jgi:hypothetical protein
MTSYALLTSSSKGPRVLASVTGANSGSYPTVLGS